jgi:hypothetical protein
MASSAEDFGEIGVWLEEIVETSIDYVAEPKDAPQDTPQRV